MQGVGGPAGVDGSGSASILRCASIGVEILFLHCLPSLDRVVVTFSHMPVCAPLHHYCHRPHLSTNSYRVKGSTGAWRGLGASWRSTLKHSLSKAAPKRGLINPASVGIKRAGNVSSFVPAWSSTSSIRGRCRAWAGPRKSLHGTGSTI